MFATGNGCTSTTDSPRDHVRSHICSPNCRYSVCSRSHRPRVAVVLFRMYRWGSRCNLYGNHWGMCCHKSMRDMVVVTNCIGKLRNHFHPDGTRGRRTCGTSRRSIPRVASVQSAQHIDMFDNRWHPTDNPRHHSWHGTSTVDKRSEDLSGLMAVQVSHKRM
jgi:hypothetical protein